MASEAELAIAYRARLRALAAALDQRIRAIYARDVGSAHTLPLAAIRIDDAGRQPLSEAIIGRVLPHLDTVPPVVVIRVGDGYALVDGRHRIEAAQRAGRREIRAFVAATPEIADAFAAYIPAAATVIEAAQRSAAQLAVAYLGTLERRT